MIRLPHLSPTAKGQLWGMLVGGSLAALAANRAGLSWGLFAIGFAAAWAVSEKFIGARLIARQDTPTVALAVVSGLAFPWVGVALAWGLELLRP